MNALQRELISAASDAEISRLAESWSYQNSESTLLTNGLSIDKTNTFRSLRRGGVLLQRRVELIQKKYPRSRITICSKHMIADVLCNPELSETDIRNHLRRLSTRLTRKHVYRRRPAMFADAITEKWTPLDEQNILALTKAGTPSSFFALICMLRIAQLTGDLRHDYLAMRAVWSMVPRLCRRSTSISYGLHALIAALDRFFSLQPFESERRHWKYIDAILGLDRYGNRNQAIDAALSIWEKDPRIPQKIKYARRERAFKMFYETEDIRRDPEVQIEIIR